MCREKIYKVNSGYLLSAAFVAVLLTLYFRLFSSAYYFIGGDKRNAPFLND